MGFVSDSPSSITVLVLLIEDDPSDFLGMAHYGHEEFLIILAGSLDFHIPEIEESGDEPADSYSHILHLVETDIRNFPVEYPSLIDCDDTFFRHIPDIEIILGPVHEEGKPEDEQPDAVEERKQGEFIAWQGEIQKVREEELKQRKCDDGKESSHD